MMQAGYQNSRDNCWHRILSVVVLAGSLSGVGMESSFAEMSDPDVLRTGKRTIVEGTYQLSPPAIQFDETGMLHLAWFEKSGDTPALKTVRISGPGNVAGKVVEVNPTGAEPDALHQAPGLAAGRDN